MKAVIVDIEGNNAVALTKNGSFIKVKNNGKLKIGYETNISSGIIRINTFVKTVSIAASVLFVIGVLGIFAYKTPYSYVDIDINPSIEITLNIFNRIIDTKALNTDGEKILNNTACKNKEVKDGIENIIKSAVSYGYLVDNNTNAVMFTVASKNTAKVTTIEKDVQSSASQELKSAKANPEVIVEKVTIKTHDEAIKQGISPGKQMLIQQAIYLNPELKAEDLKDKPVKEILNIIKDSRNENKNVKTVNGKSNEDTSKQHQNGVNVNTPRSGVNLNTPPKSNKNNSDNKVDKNNKDNKDRKDYKNNKNINDDKNIKKDNKTELNSQQKDTSKTSYQNQNNAKIKSIRDKLLDLWKSRQSKQNNNNRNTVEKKYNQDKK